MPFPNRSDRRLMFAVFALVLVAVLAEPPVGVAGRTTDETTLRHNVAWQVALESVGFSPGLIDGRIGPKTELATREFQRVRGLPVTGKLDDTTKKVLEPDPANVFGRYTIQAADLEEIGPAPKSWIARSKLKRLGHESLETVVAEKFHCARDLLQTLNPRVNIANLKAGDNVIVPVVARPATPPQAAYVEINLAEKVIRVVDEQKQLAALFHCSVAREKAQMPSGSTRVATIVKNPWYTFRPEMWPEVKERITKPLSIPPGPRNPVGRCWIGLARDGYGMHGTPNPELIGKTGSHGCFRLANWDALRLAEMVRVGTPVRFVGLDDDRIARSK